MKTRSGTFFKMLYMVSILLLISCENELNERSHKTSKEVENRSEEDYTPASWSVYTTDPTDRTTIQAKGMDLILSRATLHDFEPGNDSFYLKSYSVTEASWDEEAYHKVVHLITTSPVSKEEEIEVISSFLEGEEHVNESFNGAIAVLDEELTPEQVYMYGEGFSDAKEEDIEYRIEHVSTNFDGPATIEERNAPGCFAIYLISYGVQTGFIYNSWLIGYFCVGTGSGLSGNSSGGSSPQSGGGGSQVEDDDDSNHPNVENDNCDFTVDIGRFAGQTRIFDLMSEIDLWGSPIGMQIPIIHTQNWCSLQGYVYYQGNCDWGTNIATSSGGGCNCLEIQNTYEST